MPPPATSPRSRRVELAALTAGKGVANTALRWVGPFLPTLERAFGTTTGTLTGIIGVAELGGLTTLASGPHLDRGHERRIYLLGLAAVVVSSLVAIGGSVSTFAISYTVLVIGVGNLTVAGHAWIGHRVPYASRSRAIGVFETSWAISLLVGAPILALLIHWVGWRGPYVALAITAAVAVVAVGTVVQAPPAVDQARPVEGERARLPSTAWPPILASAFTACAGIGLFVVSGAWLDDVHGVSTGGLGLVAAGFGAVELISSTSVAAFADRVGARRSVLLGLVVLAVGVGLMAVSGSSLALAVTGLIVFLAGFEYGFVSSLTLVTEAAPLARGRVIGLSSAFGTLARSGGVIASGQLYEAVGMGGSLAMSAGAASVAMVLALVTHLR